MEDQITEIVEPPKPARKPRGKAKAKKQAAAKVKPLPTEGMLAGLSGLNCPTGCNAKHCVISGVGICAHPHKGGLQPQLQNEKSLRRFAEAQEILAHRKLRVA